MRNHLSLLFPLSISAIGLAICLQATPAQAVTEWEWSFDAPNCISGGLNVCSGTGFLTTKDVVPTANTIYDIISIAGSYSVIGLSGGTSYAIVSISNFNNADNRFSWDGTSLSEIIVSGRGFSFRTSGGFDVNLSSSAGLGPVDTSKRGTQIALVPVSSLEPVLPVPGPLPLFSAASAFGWSRRLRHRCRTTA
jgi:hypothetical protein